MNPGVLWETKYFQMGVEAVIPMGSGGGGEMWGRCLCGAGGFG